MRASMTTKWVPMSAHPDGVVRAELRRQTMHVRIRSIPQLLVTYCQRVKEGRRPWPLRANRCGHVIAVATITAILITYHHHYPPHHHQRHHPYDRVIIVTMTIVIVIAVAIMTIFIIMSMGSTA